MRAALLTAFLTLAAATACAGDGEPAGFLVESPSESPSATATEQPTAAKTPIESATEAVTPQAEATPTGPPELRLNSSTAAPGTTVVVSVLNTETAGTAYMSDREFPLVHGGGFVWGVVGLGPDAPLGPTSLNVTLDDGQSFDASIEVVDAGYPVENITLSGETSGLLTPDNAATEREKVGAAYSIFTPERLWAGPFIYPVDTYITAGFGDARSYNGGPVGSYHKGIDFGALEGTPIRAANSGRVVLAEALPLSGNSVIIDHGLGVMTLYAHMVRIDVASGQSVERGDLVGQVGTTGISTGSHLHWGVIIRGVSVNPHQWTFIEMGPP